MQRLVALIAVAVLAGCSGSLLHGPPGGPATPEQRFEAQWVGQPADDVLLKYGSPAELITLDSGNVIYSYHYETAAASSRAFSNGYGGAARFDSQAVFCDRRFEIDRTTKKVLRATIRGNGCDYSS